MAIPPVRGHSVPQPQQLSCPQGPHPAHGVIILPTGASQPTVLPLQPLVPASVLTTPKGTIKGAGGDGERPALPRYPLPLAAERRGGTAGRMLRSPWV